MLLNHNKKAMMKTIEVIIAAMITFTFVLAILPSDKKYSLETTSSLLDNIENDKAFRNCILTEDNYCINQTIQKALYGYYTYDYELLDDINQESTISLPETKVSIFSIIFSGNESYYNPKIFKLYYWINNEDNP